MQLLHQYNARRRRWASWLCLGVALLLMAPAAAAASACAMLTFGNAWVRVVPGAPVAAGYVDVTNTGTAKVTVDGVSSPQFGRVHMHESIIADDGTSTMKPIASVVVDPGKTVSFAPGGYHLMMFNAKQQLVPGDTVTLHVHCQGADMARTVKATVRNMMTEGTNHMSMGHQ